MMHVQRPLHVTSISVPLIFVPTDALQDADAAHGVCALQALVMASIPTDHHDINSGIINSDERYPLAHDNANLVN